MVFKVPLLVLIILFLFLTTNAIATDEDLARVKESLKIDAPTLNVKEVRKTEIDSLFEVLTNGKIIYYAPKSHQILFGELVSTAGESITAKRLAEVQAMVIDALPLNKAIKIGNGKHTVIEFSDPDCPYCRKTSMFFKDRTDITHYIFLFPISEIHPKAYNKGLSILCATDRGKVFHEVLSGSLDTGAIKCANETVKEELDAHIAIANNLSIHGTPALWIDGVKIAGADMLRIRELLDKQ
jgi:thiol:disulfide interchange protein DsbC